jgi:hypothetical protein
VNLKSPNAGLARVGGFQVHGAEKGAVDKERFVPISKVIQEYL